MTLMELTNHEAGIIIYPDNSVAVYNWGQLDDNQLPMMTFVGMIGFPEEDDIFADVKQRRFSDVREELPGSIWLTEETDDDGNRIADTDLDIISDDLNDLLRLFLEELDKWDYEGTCYELTDGTRILALDQWN